MLKNHNCFHYTRFPDKANDLIYLKSPKTVIGSFFDHFWSFSPNGDFTKKIPTLSCTSPYGPLIPPQVSEKFNEPIPRKRMDGRMDRRTDPISKNSSAHCPVSDKADIII